MLLADLGLLLLLHGHGQDLGLLLGPHGVLVLQPGEGTGQYAGLCNVIGLGINTIGFNKTSFSLIPLWQGKYAYIKALEFCDVYFDSVIK